MDTKKTPKTGDSNENNLDEKLQTNQDSRLRSMSLPPTKRVDCLHEP